MMSPVLVLSIGMLCTFGLGSALGAVFVSWRIKTAPSLRRAERLLGTACCFGVGALADLHFGRYLSYGEFLVCEFAGFMLYLAARRHLFRKRMGIYDREFARVMSI